MRRRLERMREAVAMAEMPEPTAYVSREWERTAAAVEDPAYLRA